jgi:hypothetical protein
MRWLNALTENEKWMIGMLIGAAAQIIASIVVHFL